MKIFFTTILITMAIGQVSAQLSLFFRPTVSMKAYVSTIDNGKAHDISNYALPNADYHFQNKLFSLRSIIDFGLNVGIAFDDKKHLLEFGWSQDATGSRAILFHKYYHPEMGEYSQVPSSFSSAIYTHRFSFQYSYQLNKHKKTGIFQSDFHLMMGGGWIFSPKARNIRNPPSPNIYDQFDFSTHGSTLIGPNKTITWNQSVYANARTSLMLQVGLSSDFYVKNKYIFSLSIFYTQGFKTLERTVHSMIVTENSTTTTNHIITVSKGSGLYFQISRRLQFYPWKKLRKKKKVD